MLEHYSLMRESISKVFELAKSFGITVRGKSLREDAKIKKVDKLHTEEVKKYYVNLILRKQYRQKRIRFSQFSGKALPYNKLTRRERKEILMRDFAH